MKWLTFKVRQEAGFRLNLIDLLFIALLCTAAAWLKAVMPELSVFYLPLYVGLTFFLFCNVFRIGNRAEVWWYLPFAATAAAAIHTLRLEEFWWSVLFFFEPLKIWLITRAMLKETYHGVFYRQLRSGAEK